MSLFGAMWTSVSGMNAQSTRISSVADNIANSSTTGYKRSNAEFETILVDSSAKSYSSGSVSTIVRAAVSEQGALQRTSSVTDLAIQGGGFFVVAAPNGTPYLTRAGAFVPDSAGNLINSAGYTLLGIDMASAGAVSPTISSLVPININQAALVASPSTSAQFTVNLPSQASVIAAGSLPSDNVATSTFTAKSSMTAYDNLGAPMNLDIYFAKTGANTWEASIYDSSASTNGGFPYSSGPMTTQTVTFSGTDGSLTSGSPLSVAIPNGGTLNIDISKTTQFAAGYSVSTLSVNGGSPSKLDHIEIADTGVLSFVYTNGVRVPSYRIPLATCASPDLLNQNDGNAFSESPESGNIIVGDAQTGKLGSIQSNTLEASTVDLASELTNMIAAQRGYTANSKVFQAASDLMDVLINIKA